MIRITVRKSPILLLNSDLADLPKYAVTKVDIISGTTLTISIPSTTGFFGEVKLWRYVTATLSNVCYRFNVYYTNSQMYVSPISDSYSDATITNAQISNGDLVITFSTSVSLRINAIMYA